MAPHCSTCCCQLTQSSFETPGIPDDLKAHILSNEPPSASDLPMLREYKLSLDPYLTRLDTEISALSAMQEQLEKELYRRQARLDALRTERRALGKRQQLVSGALSPLRCLPLEVLQEIFLYTLRHSREQGYTWFYLFHLGEPPWTLRRVCRKWRTATEYPHLWTGLVITRLGNLPVLKDGLERSRSLPLRIRFSWDDPLQPGSGIVLDELLKHSERWQYASFHCKAQMWTQSISALRGRLPKLEELHFLPWGVGGTDYIENGHSFEIAPSLRKAVILRSVVKLDYSRLESFTSDALTPAAFEVLVSSPYLTYLADHSCAVSHDDPPQGKTRYIHSRLNTLLLKECGQLDMFTLPNLQDLEVGAPYANELSPSLPIISQFLHVSRCPLSSLSIHNCDLSLGSMPELLQLVLTLQSLTININSFTMDSGAVSSTDEALNVLMNRLGERTSKGLTLVANLRSFAFRSHLKNSWHFMDASIAAMIRMRGDMHSVSFIIHRKALLPNLSKDNVARLRTFKKNGFDISIVMQDTDDDQGLVFI